MSSDLMLCSNQCCKNNKITKLFFCCDQQKLWCLKCSGIECSICHKKPNRPIALKNGVKSSLSSLSSSSSSSVKMPKPIAEPAQKNTKLKQAENKKQQQLPNFSKINSQKQYNHSNPPKLQKKIYTNEIQNQIQSFSLKTSISINSNKEHISNFKDSPPLFRAHSLQQSKCISCETPIPFSSLNTISSELGAPICNVCVNQNKKGSPLPKTGNHVKQKYKQSWIKQQSKYIRYRNVHIQQFGQNIYQTTLIPFRQNQTSNSLSKKPCLPSIIEPQLSISQLEIEISSVVEISCFRCGYFIAQRHNEGNQQYSNKKGTKLKCLHCLTDQYIQNRLKKQSTF